MNKPSVFSFFSGCGILDLGFERSGYNVVFVNEFSSAFLSAYKYSRTKMGIEPPKYGYANTDVNVFLNERSDELTDYIDQERAQGNLIGFIGGPPCPDFSVGGKNRGRDGDNGKLSLSYVELIRHHCPDFFLFENVKGLWRTAKHREFYDELKNTLYDAGYVLTDRLTNALEFGAPQDRDRILLIGIKKEIVKTEEKHIMDFPWGSHIVYDLERTKSLPWPTQNDYHEDSITECPENIPEELTVEYWFRKNKVTSHPDANRFFKPKAGLERMKVIAEGDSNKKSYKRVHRWRYSPTVCYGNNEVHLHPYKSRRLSVAEAMSLQSLPAEFCLPPEMTLSACFKTIGNGVPLKLAQGVAQTLLEYLKEKV